MHGGTPYCRRRTGRGLRGLTRICADIRLLLLVGVQSAQSASQVLGPAQRVRMASATCLRTEQCVRGREKTNLTRIYADQRGLQDEERIREHPRQLLFTSAGGSLLFAPGTCRRDP